LTVVKACKDLEVKVFKVQLALVTL